MKTILVPTDFSEPAENAARYALHLSKTLKSNLRLCHAFFVPADAPMAARIAWPLYEYSTMEAATHKQLHQLVKKLAYSNEVVSNLLSFQPSIEYNGVAGEVIPVINELVEEKRIGMVIMGMSGKGDYEHFPLGSNSRRMIEGGSCPVLLVPGSFLFKGIRKIAFATDLNQDDVELIHSLATIASKFDAEIIVIHISTKHKKDEALESKETAFLKNIRELTNYQKIYYREVKNSDIDKGLDQLGRDGNIDMLAMVHRPKGFFGKLFQGSHTKRQANYISIPLLVFPAHKRTSATGLSKKMLSLY